jgi:hypothetical protein
MMRLCLMSMITVAHSQDPKEFIGSKGSWDYKITTSEEGVTALDRSGHWIDATSLKGNYSREKPSSANLWIVGSYLTPYLIVDVQKNRLDIFRVCRDAC